MTVLQPCLTGLPFSDGHPPEIGTPLLLERPGLRLHHHRRWLQQGERSSPGLEHHLIHDLPWQQPEVVVYGRRHPTPRLCCWVADPGCAYRYSALVQPITAWTPLLSLLRQRLEQALSVRFNSLLLNRYRSGADRMGWHADDEAELDPESPIASLSLGVSRTLRFRPRPGSVLAAAEATFAIHLADGDLLVMEPPTQAHWQHALPPRLRVRGERLNLTFRRIRRPL
jgi:alkylated DNA repair dioxygenase AlkB